jgi:hypothetical protein
VHWKVHFIPSMPAVSFHACCFLPCPLRTSAWQRWLSSAKTSQRPRVAQRWSNRRQKVEIDAVVMKNAAVKVVKTRRSSGQKRSETHQRKNAVVKSDQTHGGQGWSNTRSDAPAHWRPIDRAPPAPRIPPPRTAHAARAHAPTHQHLVVGKGMRRGGAAKPRASAPRRAEREANYAIVFF